MKPQGLVAENNTYRQLHNCHNNVKSEIQAKFFQVKLVLKSMLGSKKVFSNF